MHILRSKALGSVSRDAPPMPQDAHYDPVLGAWRGGDALLAYDADATRNSKKHDVETGEDQKGQ